MDPSRGGASSWPASGHGSSQSLTRSSLPGSGRQARTASVLRLLDVAPWMLHSEATAARNARAAASVTPQR
jgi:hypothetical protein